MKLIIKTHFRSKSKDTEKLYLVRLPNYFDTSKLDELLNDIKFDLPNNETIVEHNLYGDAAMTLFEKTQLDLHGEIITPLIELKVSV